MIYRSLHKYKQFAIKYIALQAIIMPASIIISHAGSLSVSVVDKDGKPAPNAVVMVSPSGAVNRLHRHCRHRSYCRKPICNSAQPWLLVQKGAKVTFVNNDPWDHHVRGSAAGSKEFSSSTDENGFSFRLAGKTSTASNKINSSTVTFDKAGVTLLACHLHGSMIGHVVVSDSPFAAKTDANGVANFADLPEGAAVIKVWHAAQFVELNLCNQRYQTGC